MKSLPRLLGVEDLFAALNLVLLAVLATFDHLHIGPAWLAQGGFVLVFLTATAGFVATVARMASQLRARHPALGAALRLRFPRVVAWLRQTSTIVGIATAVGLVASAVRGTMGWDVAVPGLASCLVAIAMPGHSDADAAVRKAALDAVLMVRGDPRSPGLGGLVVDGAAAVDGLRNKPDAQPVTQGQPP